MKLVVSAMPYQEEALFDFDTQFCGVSGGKRSGKSRMITCMKAIILSSLHPGLPGLIASPIYGMTRRNLLPIFRELAEMTGIPIRGLNVKSPDHLEIDWGDKTSIIWLDCTIENWSRLNGLSLAWACVDETDKARADDVEPFMEELIIRCSNPYPNRVAQINITGAPELNGYMAEFFMDNANPKKKLYKWSMMQNTQLSAEYKQTMVESIPESKQGAWIHGEFMFNSEGLVYDDYDPDLNHIDTTLNDIHAIEKVHVCFDINDGGTSVVIGVRRQHHMLILDEWMGMKDTDAVINKVKQQPWANQAILSCDPACTQVFSYITKSGLNYMIMNSSPEICHRVTAVNTRFGTKSKFGTEEKRHLLINTKKCRVLNKCLMRQGYIKGEPDKKTWVEGAKTDISGPLDALGYLIYREWPYNPKNPGQPIKLRGF